LILGNRQPLLIKQSIANIAILSKFTTMHKAVEVALKYVGQKELDGNRFSESEDFGKKLKAVGQQDGMPWCALFCEMVFKEAYPARFAEFDKLFSASAVQTYKNFSSEKGGGYLLNALPKEGNIVIWQKYIEGKPQWQGHAGIVYQLKSTWEFTSIEGNTNEAGGREGNSVQIKDRKVIKNVWNGLKVLGFIQV
jgi:hypothetical protein